MRYYATMFDSQLFKAADNSSVATLTHGSKVNRACFTTVSADGKTGTAQWRMVTICDNKTVNMFDFEGKQVWYCSYISLQLNVYALEQCFVNCSTILLFLYIDVCS